MTMLILGLAIFLGVHATRVFAEPWRTAQIARMGQAAWKGAYSAASLAGLALVIWGYGLARQDPVALWAPSVGMRHIAALLTLLAFVVLAAAYVPGNSVKARIGHPMVAAVKLWALAHLLANHTLADLLLFGGFLLWAVLCFRAARARDRAAGVTYPAGTLQGNALTLVAGVAAWTLLAFGVHGWLFGVRPFG